MSTAIVPAPKADEGLANVLLHGDVARLTPQQKVAHYLKVCDSLGLNPLTQPFLYVRLQGKETFYATKSCTEQLRLLRKVSIQIVSREVVEGCYIVAARATDGEGRHDEAIGAVPIEGQKGESRSNAMMKAETKAKRRVTLSICGLGMLDESEIDSIPGAVRIPAAAIEAARANDTQAETTPKPVDVVEPPSEEVADILAQPSDPSPADAGEESGEDVKALRAEAARRKWSKPHAKNWLRKHFHVDSADALTKQQAADALALMLASDNETAYGATLETFVAQGRAYE